jgi:hypothetical protein
MRNESGLLAPTADGCRTHGDPDNIGENVQSGRPFGVAVDGTILRKP